MACYICEALPAEVSRVLPDAGQLTAALGWIEDSEDSEGWAAARAMGLFDYLSGLSALKAAPPGAVITIANAPTVKLTSRRCSP